MIKYKLTSQELTTNNGCVWVRGERKVITTNGARMCSNDVFHGYHSPEQAVLFNPVHANILTPRLWRVEIDSVCVDDGLKFGCKEMTIIEELPLPTFTLEERIAFAIYCGEPYEVVAWRKWAADWMSGKDRTTASAAGARADAENDDSEARSGAGAAAAGAAAAGARAGAEQEAAAEEAAAWAADAISTWAAWENGKIDFNEIIKKVRNHETV